MEGSVAGQAGQGQGEAGEAATQQGDGVAGFADQLAQLQSGQEEMRSFLNNFAQQQQQQTGEESADEGSQELDLSFLDDPVMTPEQIASHMAGLIDQRSQAQMAPMSKAMQELSSGLDELKLQRDFDALVTEFPEIGDPETTTELLGTAGQYAQQLGKPELATSPAFIRLVYMSGRAAEMANSETQGPGVAVLEGGGGAGPGAVVPDRADQILNAKKGRGVLPF